MGDNVLILRHHAYRGFHFHRESWRAHELTPGLTRKSDTNGVTSSVSRKLPRNK